MVSAMEETDSEKKVKNNGSEGEHDNRGEGGDSGGGDAIVVMMAVLVM